ncbi:MAG: thermonuclease family protein [Henriciella sp.]
MHRVGLVFLLGVLAACGSPSPLPDMQPGETGRVVRVIDGDALALNTGQSVRLIGIEAPALRPRGRDPDVYAAEAARTLEDMALGREVRLYYSGMTRDRYDRALAHVVTLDRAGPQIWLNMELVERGAARARFYPDTSAREEEFLNAERIAREGKTGLWSKAAYRPLEASAITDELRGYMVILAKLGRALPPEGEYAYNQSCQRKTLGAELMIEIRKDAGAICDLPEGTAMRLRGWVSDQKLDLTLSHHAEPIEPAP